MKPTPPWLGHERTAWLSDVGAWVGDATEVSGVGALIELDPVKERAWGAVLRAVTAGGTFFFKASGPLCRHELVVISTLARRWPTLVPDVLALDTDRSWMLMADHGRPMRDVLPVATQLAVIEGLMPAYADMQASTAEEVPVWLGLQVPDRRVGRLPELLDLLLHGETPIGPLPIDDDERAAYAADGDLLTRVCADLSSTPAADAIDHADLHGTNVLIDGSDHRLVDWGDSCVTHPFSTLFVVYELVVASLPLTERRAQTLRLRDAYLERWGSSDDNREAFGLAVWVAHITRAVNIAHEALGDTDDHEEITALLRAWHAKRSLVGRGDDLLIP